MELDDMKLAWQTLDRRLDLQNALSLHQFKERKLDKARSNLRRLYWGQIVQILFGDALILLGIFASIRYRDTAHLLACSLSMLLYGGLIVVFGGITLGTISRIDYAAPVIDIQKQVSRLRRIRTFTSLWAGLPWWFLWIAIFVIEVKANLGVDLFVTAPAFVWISAGIGVAGLLATWRFHRGTRQPQRSRLAKAFDDSIAGRNLRHTERDLDEIARFEQM